MHTSTPDSCTTTSLHGTVGVELTGRTAVLLPVTALMENPLRAEADFGTVIDFLKNLAIMGGLLLVVLKERDANH